MNNLFERLQELTNAILDGNFGESTYWQGADVVIDNKIHEKSVGNFYSDPRYVITPFAGELSWLFEALKPIFSTVEGYGIWKEEFFGRLGNMANRAKDLNKAETARDLLLSVLHEAFSCAEEISQGHFQYLLVTSGNAIYQDLIEKAVLSGSVSESSAEEFLRSQGLL